MFNLESLFEQTMMPLDWIPRRYIPSFLEIRPSNPEKIFEVFFLLNVGEATILVRLHTKFGFELKSGFREEDLCKVFMGGRKTDGDTPEHGYTISSSGEPNESSELEIFSYVCINSRTVFYQAMVVSVCRHVGVSTCGLCELRQYTFCLEL